METIWAPEGHLAKPGDISVITTRVISMESIWPVFLVPGWDSVWTRGYRSQGKVPPMCRAVTPPSHQVDCAVRPKL